MKKIIIPIIFLLCMSFVYADPLTSGWNSFGDDTANQEDGGQAMHRLSITTGRFTNTSRLMNCTIAHGVQAGTEPLIYDFDEDGTKELFLPSIDDDYIRFYDPDCNLEKELAVGEIDGQACMFTADNDWSNLPVIAIEQGSNVSILEWNGTSINIITSVPINWTTLDGNYTNATKPYFTCFSGWFNQDAIYWVDDYNHINSIDNETYYNTTYGITMTSPSGTAGEWYDGNYRNNSDYNSINPCMDCKSTIYFVDLDKDSSSEDMIWRYKDHVFSYGGSKSFVTNISDSCDYSLGTFMPYMMIKDKSSGSDYSVFVANDGKQSYPTAEDRCAVLSTPNWGCLVKILSTGVTDWNKSYFNLQSIFSGSDKLQKASVSSFGSIHNDGEERIWTIGGGSGEKGCPISGGTSVYKCSYMEWDFDGVLVINTTTVTGGLSCSIPSKSSGYFANDILYNQNSFDLDFGFGSLGEIGQIDAYVLGNGLYPTNFNGSNTARVMVFPYANSIFEDFDFDGYGDIINFNTVAVKVMESGYINYPPITNNGTGDTCSPVCYGETVSLDVGYSDIELNAVYSSVDCFNTNEWSDWSSISYNPTVSCLMNTSSGSHTMRIRTTDTANLGNETSYSIIDLDYTVALSNCYDGGEVDDVCTPIGGTAGSGSAGHNATDYGLLVNGTDDNTSIDGYSPRNIDWSGCEDWVILYSLCPLWTMYTVGIGDFVKWVLGGIIIVIATILLYVFLIYKNKNK